MLSFSYLVFFKVHKEYNSLEMDLSREITLEHEYDEHTEVIRDRDELKPLANDLKRVRLNLKSNKHEEDISQELIEAEKRLSLLKRLSEIPKKDPTNQQRLSRNPITGDFLKTCFFDSLQQYFSENENMLSLNAIKFLSQNRLHINDNETFVNRIMSNMYTVFILVFNVIVNSIVILLILILKGVDLQVYINLISITFVFISLFFSLLVILFYVKLTTIWFSKINDSYRLLPLYQNDIFTLKQYQRTFFLNNILITSITLLVMSNVIANVFFYLIIVHNFKN